MGKRSIDGNSDNQELISSPDAIYHDSYLDIDMNDKIKLLPSSSSSLIIGALISQQQEETPSRRVRRMAPININNRYLAMKRKRRDINFDELSFNIKNIERRTFEKSNIGIEIGVYNAKSLNNRPKRA